MHFPDDNTVTGILTLPGGSNIKGTVSFTAVVNLNLGRDMIIKL